MVWYGMVWYGMVWYGMVWYCIVLYDMVWYGMVWYGMVCSDQDYARCGPTNRLVGMRTSTYEYGSSMLRACRSEIILAV